MATSEDKIIWSGTDMIESTAEWFGRDVCDPTEFRIIESTQSNGDPCLVVLHAPTGRTSDEAGDAGRWNLDGTARD